MSLWRLARNTAGALVSTALLSRLLGIIVLWPLFSLVARLTVEFGGDEAVTDMDLIGFLLHPIGLTGTLLCLVLAVAIAALEQVALLVICLAGQRGRSVSAFAATTFAWRHAGTVVNAAARVVGWSLLLTSPFAAVAALAGWWLLTAHDINYYLANKPPEFWGAIAVGVLTAGTFAWRVVPKLLGWLLVLPLVVSESIPSRRLLQESSSLSAGRRWNLFGAICVWLAVLFALSSATSILAWLLTRTVAPIANSSWIALLPVLGVCCAAWTLAQMVISLLHSISFALIVAGQHAQVAAGSPRLDLLLDRLATHGNEGEAASNVWQRSVSLAARRPIRMLTAGLLVALLLGGWLLVTAPPDEPTIVIAHRGASAAAPENTLAAMARAIEDDADMVELDVQETSDGEVVVIHDSDIMRLARDPRKVWTMTAAEITTVDVGAGFSRRFRGETIPRLADVLALCRGRIRMDIELKSYGHNQRLEERVAGLVEAAGMQDEIVIMSLDHKMIRRMQELRPDWTVGLLTAVAIGDLPRFPADFLAVSSKLATPSLIRQAHRQGREVYVWTVDDPQQMSRFLSYGADGLITNRPEIARRVLARRLELNPTALALVDLAQRSGLLVRQPLGDIDVTEPEWELTEE
jgi:glycerophosphoryl diester phosphodiesterase